MIRLGKELFGICRSITGNGQLKTLRILKKKEKKLKIGFFKTNKRYFDWFLPYEWNIKDAYVKDPNGYKVIDFKNNNLHVVGYSFPIKKKIKKKDLLEKLHTLPRQKNYIPYITSYYKKIWGFCCSENLKKKIISKYRNDDLFEISIDSKLKKNGKMHYGEYFIKGKSKKEILISSYICHPSMANNELSGPLVAMKLIDHFKKKKNKYSLRFIFVSETIGVIAYINKNLKKMKQNIIAGYVLTCIGDERKYSYMPSIHGNSISDKVVYELFKRKKINYKKYSFLERGSDERQYNSPNVSLPIGSIMRSKYQTYSEYHTSADIFGHVVTQKGLNQSFNFVKECINIINKEPRPKLLTICEPQMSKRNLYPSLSTKIKTNDTKNIMNFLAYCDGKNNLTEISRLIKIKKSKAKNIFNLLLKNKLISI